MTARPNPRLQAELDAYTAGQDAMDTRTMNIKTTYPRLDVVHTVGFWQHWLDRLHLAVPTALCGAYLGVDEPDGPGDELDGETEDDFDPDKPACERCERRARPRSLSERFRDWRESRRQQKATAAEWSEAETFADLCGLTARWLEGGLAFHPGGYDEPDEETTELVPFLAGLNRGGFLTFGSQPGIVCTGYDDAQWKQRAAVDGFVADPAVLRALSQAAVDAGLWIVTQAPAKGPRYPAFSILTTSMDIVLSTQPGDGPGAGPDEDGQVVVSTRDGVPCTNFGGRMPARYIRFTYGGCCNRDAVDAVKTAQQVAIIDPIWGRDDLLWPTLTNALTDLTDPTALTRRTAPREDTGR